ncbi:MAG TPA: hypothetical protein VLY21_05195 [Nitrososphaerales archaeon]|nr:hypothetical protein [Nitrososphaerales archaeon]
MSKTNPEVTARLLRHELDSWRPFAEALHEDERRAFRNLLEKAWRYSEAIESSGKTYLVEPFFLSILLTQEERIAFLQDELQKLRSEVEAWKSKAGS